jgi:hypothetical protein
MARSSKRGRGQDINGFDDKKSTIADSQGANNAGEGVKPLWADEELGNQGAGSGIVYITS